MRLGGPLLALFALSGPALAHISLSEPKARYWDATEQEADQEKLKFGPCGVKGDSRTTNQSLITTLRPGQKLTLRWNETIQHPGHYRIAFDSDGQDFPFPGTTDMPAGVTILADKITDKGGGNGVEYTYEVTLPNVECTRCTLQLVQVMTTQAPPYMEGDGRDLYFNCADLVLSGGSGGAGTGSGGSGGASVGGSGGGGRGGAGASAGAGGANPSSGGSSNAGASGAASGGAATAGSSSGGMSTGSGGAPAGAGASAGGAASGGAPGASGSPSSAGSGGTTGGAASSGGSGIAGSEANDTESGCSFGARTQALGFPLSLVAFSALFALRRRRALR